MYLHGIPDFEVSRAFFSFLLMCKNHIGHPRCLSFTLSYVDFNTPIFPIKKLQQQ